MATHGRSPEVTWYSLAEVAAALGVSTATVSRMVRRGELRAQRISPKCVRVSSEEVARFGERANGCTDKRTTA